MGISVVTKDWDLRLAVKVQIREVVKLHGACWEIHENELFVKINKISLK